MINLFLQQENYCLIYPFYNSFNVVRCFMKDHPMFKDKGFHIWLRERAKYAIKSMNLKLITDLINIYHTDHQIVFKIMRDIISSIKDLKDVDYSLSDFYDLMMTLFKTHNKDNLFTIYISYVYNCVTGIPKYSSHQAESYFFLNAYNDGLLRYYVLILGVRAANVILHQSIFKSSLNKRTINAVAFAMNQYPHSILSSSLITTCTLEHQNQLKKIQRIASAKCGNNKLSDFDD